MRLSLRFAVTMVAGAQPQPPIDPVKTTIVITANSVELEMDRRNSEVFERTLFSRGDQVFHVLDAGTPPASTKAMESRWRSGASASTCIMAA